MSPKGYQLKFDGFSILPTEKLLINGDQIISLSNRAFDLLHLFAQNEGKVILKQELLDTVWADTFVEEGNLAVAINSLRKALKTDDNRVYIETFPKRGYRFNAQVEKIEVQSSLEKDTKQPFSLSASNHSVQTESSTASLPQSAQKTTRNFVQSQLAQRKWLLFALTLMFLSYSVITIAFPNKTQGHELERNTSDKVRIAILPFVDLRPSFETRELGIGFADSTMFELSQTQEFTVAPISLEKYFQKIPQPEELKQEVDADYVLSGTFIKNGENVEVDSQLVEVKTGKVVMTNKENLKNARFSTMKEQFTKKIISKIKFSSSALSAVLRKIE